MKKKLKLNIFSLQTVFLLIVALVLGFSVYTWNAKYLVGDPMPMPLGAGVSVVLTGSMEPELYAGDVVVIRKSMDIAVDDIVVFVQDNMLVIHRVKEINGTEVTTKGDANNGTDAPVSMEDIKGELWFKIPGAGGVVNAVRHPITVLLVAGVALFLSEWAYKREKKKIPDDIAAIRKEIEQLKQQTQSAKDTQNIQDEK